MELLGDGDDEFNTPLPEGAMDGLIPPWVSTRGDLNEVEAANIAAGYLWLEENPPTAAQLADEFFLKDLHRKLLGDVWMWAGSFRTVDTNLGVDRADIAVEVRKLVDDVRYRLTETPLDHSDTIDELCVEFHHRLVWIHPFANGNGRHARAAADVLAQSLGTSPFTWGRHSIVSNKETRVAYVNALRQADQGDLQPLLQSARS